MKKILVLLALLWGLPAAAQNLPPGSQGAACLASAGAPTFTANNWFPLSCDLFGNLRTSGGGGGGGGGGSANPYPGADYATSTAQTTGNNTAATNATNTGNVAAATGAQSDAAYSGTGTGSLVALNKGQYAILSSLLTTYGAQADAAAVTGNGSVIALTKAIRDRLSGTLTVGGTVAVSNNFLLDSTLTARLGTLGQKASAGSAPVVIASDQASLPVYGSVTANLGTLNGAATSANQTAVSGSAAAGTAASQSLLTGGIYRATPPTLGDGQQQGLRLAADGSLVVSGGTGGGGGGGSVTQGTSPWVISGNATANGSGNPIFMSVTNLPATQAISATQLPTTLGVKTAANSLAIAPASDSTFPVSGTVNVGNLPATQAVSNAGTFAVQNTSAIIGGNTAAVKTDGSATTQPISGSVTANLGTLGGAATAANQTSVIGSATAGTAAASSLLAGGVYNSTAPTLTNGQQSSFQFDVNGKLLVSGAGGGGSSGSIGSAGTNGTTAQSIQGINGGVAVPVSGTFFQATQPISAASLPLPTGAATAAKQPALGTAGTASADVISVQGVAGGVAQPISGTVTAAVSNQITGYALASNQPSPQTAGSAATGTGLRAMGNDGAAIRDILTTTSGALEPPTAASGKITVTSTALTANTNTTIAAANANRIAMGIQCGSGGVNVSETGATLASATFGATGSSLTIPTGTTPYFTPPVTTRTAVTAYTATAQTCVVTEYLR